MTNPWREAIKANENPSCADPAGLAEPFAADDDLLTWMGRQFDQFGDIFKSSVHGTSVYVIRDPTYEEHVLRKNWQNYVKGQAIKRVAFLLGSGLMASEGTLWKTQRRMIQPSGRREVPEGAVWNFAQSGTSRRSDPSV